MTKHHNVLHNIKIYALDFVYSFYRSIRPFMGPAVCRFTPSCSVYAYQAVQKYGIFKGAALSVKRLSRCHPWCKGGYDPLP